MLLKIRQVAKSKKLQKEEYNAIRNQATIMDKLNN